MKGFLFDENLPQNFTFAPALPVVHARNVGVSAPDSALWECARNRELVIVSKDTDFSHRIMMSTTPPWIVHLRFGNLRRREFHALQAHVWRRIEALLPEHKLVNVFADRIEAVKCI